MKKIIIVALLLAANLYALSDSFGKQKRINTPMNAKVNYNDLQSAFDNSRTTENILKVDYRPDSIVKIRTRLAIRTNVILPENEKIFKINFGDSSLFDIKILDQQKPYIFYIQPKAAGVDTNINVIGESGRIYSFYVRSDNTKSKIMPHFIVYITLGGEEIPLYKKIYPKIQKAEDQEQASDYLKTLRGVDLTRVNFKYGCKGADEQLRPLAIFDDNIFTYFRFAKNDDESIKYPLVYKVEDGVDQPTNNRVEHGYLIAETVSDLWIIRSGEKYLCVKRNYQNPIEKD